MSVDNLESTLRQAKPTDWETGLGAFQRYNKIVTEVALQTETTPCIAAAVFSALSPNSDYHGNLKDMRKLLCAARDGLTIDEFTVSTYGQNKRKAWRIVHGEDPLKLIIADKTRNFFLNIENPLNPYPVTIDGHMYNIWNGKKQNLVGLRTHKSLYHVVADGVRKLACQEGVLPNQMQGILWHTWKRIHSIRHSTQLTFWSDDFAYAGLGYQ